MDTLDTHRILLEVMSVYAKPAANGTSELVQSNNGQTLAVIDTYQFKGKRHSDAGLIVHQNGQLILIERDMNNKPLVDALLQAGIDRKNIILAYQGEPVPVST